MVMVTDYEIECLGVHFPDYFPGASVENYDYKVIGIGSTEEEALEDALDQMAMEDWEIVDDNIYQNCREWELPNGRREGCSPYVYVVIRWRKNNENYS